MLKPALVGRIIGFDVHGHADVTLRIPPGPERDQTELEVSRDRAENAHALLLQMIEEEGGKGIAAVIRSNSSAVGVGSKCRKVIPAHTEAEMRKNRRVEIFLKEFRVQPAPPTPPDPPKPPVPDQHWSVRIKRGKVVTSSVPGTDLLGTAVISLDVVIKDLDRKQQATFSARSEGLTVGGNVGVSPLPAATLVTNVLEGDAVRFTTHHPVQGISLNSFEGSLTMGQNPGLAASVASVKGEFTMIFTRLTVSTSPKVVVVEGKNDPFTIPQGSLGVAPGEGRLKMQGGPVPVQ